MPEGDGTVELHPGERHDYNLAKYTESQEARVVSKLDWNLMTLFFVLCELTLAWILRFRPPLGKANELTIAFQRQDMLAFLDRGNIGNARIAGLQEDFNLVGDRYQWLINIFYIAYVISEFGILLWKLFPPHIVGAIVVFGWYVAAPCYHYYSAFI